VGRDGGEREKEEREREGEIKYSRQKAQDKINILDVKK
jgi:hypothetical protein